MATCDGLSASLLHPPLPRFEAEIGGPDLGGALIITLRADDSLEERVTCSVGVRAEALEMTTTIPKKSLRGSRNLKRPANAAHRIVVYFPVAGNSGSLSVSRIPPHGMLPTFAIKLAAVR